MANSVKATWLGHSTFTFETPEGKTLLIDPWVKNNPMCPPNLKKLAKVDLVLCTHGHFDHIGDAVEICKEHNPMVVGIFELCAWLNKKGAKQISPMNKGGSQTVENVRVTMVDAVHSSGIQDGDSIIYGGEPCGFVMEFSNGQKIYHAGDTAVFGDMALIRELYAPQIVMLPIGDHFTMGPREAEVACRLLRPKILIPMHCGTFPVLTGKPSDLAKAAREQGFEILEFKPGERKELPSTS
ncbi:MAG: metal-dependent hydrolase [Candidatus Korobacteraceae bacterium]|jgi:L-ascorbate metabolism protein UlaG (beta-lactamase superfamily)